MQCLQCAWSEWIWQIKHLAIRAAINSGKVDVVAINDPFIDLKYMVFLSKYDSTHGKFNGTVKAENRKLVTNGNFIFNSPGCGTSTVIISAPSAHAPMFVKRLNRDRYDNSLKIVGNASCITTVCPPKLPQPRSAVTTMTLRKDS
ncbi:Glyceraldehyde-3-phosphate dehydrogenase [Galemys pyrenaicus]|uniref:Glyceraldehyde-3-phosphate dehydrogenase n=1 Tax=Galemys pyrenaicus TaxID=202257 RepID=A0A8J6AY81_GALPY|nr:Glyceraldehyde-3-phosphate dehydrogenase [Galemys pyrenaicus]